MILSMQYCFSQSKGTITVKKNDSISIIGKWVRIEYNLKSNNNVEIAEPDTLYFMADHTYMSRGGGLGMVNAVWSIDKKKKIITYKNCEYLISFNGKTYIDKKGTTLPIDNYGIITRDSLTLLHYKFDNSKTLDGDTYYYKRIK